jgi:hypothetical protein
VRNPELLASRANFHTRFEGANEQETSAMERRGMPGDSDAQQFASGSDGDYILAMSARIQEGAVDPLPWWAWALCMAVLATLGFFLFWWG